MVFRVCLRSRPYPFAVLLLCCSYIQYCHTEFASPADDRRIVWEIYADAIEDAYSRNDLSALDQFITSWRSDSEIAISRKANVLPLREFVSQAEGLVFALVMAQTQVGRTDRLWVVQPVLDVHIVTSIDDVTIEAVSRRSVIHNDVNDLRSIQIKQLSGRAKSGVTTLLFDEYRHAALEYFVFGACAFRPLDNKSDLKVRRDFIENEKRIAFVKNRFQVTVNHDGKALHIVQPLIVNAMFINPAFDDALVVVGLPGEIMAFRCARVTNVWNFSKSQILGVTRGTK